MLGWGGGGHVNVLCTAYIRCCYAAEISGLVATLHVATLQKSLVSLPRNMGWGGGVGWGGMLTFFVVRTLDVATLQRSLVSLLRYMLLRCRDLWFRCYATWGGVGGHVNVLCSAYIRCCYAAEISGFVATLHVATLQKSLVSLLRNMGWGGGVGWGGMLTFFV